MNRNLFLLTLLLGMSFTSQKGKTYEDLAKLIKDSNQLHVKDEDDYYVPPTPSVVEKQNEDSKPTTSTVTLKP